MICSKTGFSPLKIAALVVGGIAIVTHITAVAYPEWDGIDLIMNPSPVFSYSITAQGSLWDFTLHDPTSNFFIPIEAERDTSKFNFCLRNEIHDRKNEMKPKRHSVSKQGIF